MPKLPKYDPAAMEAAIVEINNDPNKSLRAVAKNYGLPRTSLQFKLKHPAHKNSFGPSPVLTKEEEDTLVRWILEMARKGFPRKREDIISSVQNFLILNPRPNPFRNNRPGEGWLKAFLRRHPQITERTSESVTAASSRVSESDVRKWFCEVKDYIKEKNLEEAMKDPSRVFNGDETGFQICPSTGRVLAKKGAKNVYSVQEGPSKENITVMFTFSASGKTCCPMIVYPYKRIPEKISESVPKEWGIARSDSGWMTCEVFFEYIANVFHPFLVSEGITLPVVLFVDGHKSHLTYQISVLCRELQIEIIALYPNATRILQPADVAVFRPLKVCWRKTVHDWYSNHPGEVLNKLSFAPLLKKVVEAAAKPETLAKGFEVCGICPLNPDAVDYSKCLGKSTVTAVPKEHGQISCNEDNISNVVMNYDTFLSIVGAEKIEKFENSDGMILQESSEDFISLLRIWKYFKREKNFRPMPGSESSNAASGMIQCKSHSSNLKDIDCPSTSGTPKREGTRNISSNVTPNNASQHNQERAETSYVSSNRIHTGEGENSTSTTTSVIKRARLDHMEEFLVWPETPKRKGKKSTVRQPFAVTSKKYQDMFEKKRLAKLAAEEEKEQRKRNRAEMKGKKESKASDRCTIKRKLFEKGGNEILCCICHGRIKNGREIRCDDCRRSFHEKCVPNNHKKHIPLAQDEDGFLCHFCYNVKSASEVEDFSDSSVPDDDDDVGELYNLVKGGI